MQYFDFHNHKTNAFGIYNLTFGAPLPKGYFSVGIHPKDADNNTDLALDWLKETSQHPHCLAIGECGLDALVTVDKTQQEKIFKQQIIWANTIQKPIIVHCVRLFPEVIKLKKLATVPMIIHGYNKKPTIAQQLKSEGFYLSFGKSLLENLSLQTIFEAYPTDRLFLETDDADFDIASLYKLAAELKNIPIENLQSKIDHNLKQIL